MTGLWCGESPEAEEDTNGLTVHQHDQSPRLYKHQREQKERTGKSVKENEFASDAASISSAAAERNENKLEDDDESGGDVSKCKNASIRNTCRVSCVCRIGSRCSGRNFHTTYIYAEDADSETEAPPKKLKRHPDFIKSENEREDGGSESSRGVSSGMSRALSSSGVTKDQQIGEAGGGTGNEGHVSSSNSNSAAPPFIIPQDSIKDFHFSDYEPGSYERVERRRRRWLWDNWSVEGDLGLLGDCTPPMFCQCHRPSKRAAVLGEMSVPVLDPSHLRDLRNVAEEEDFKANFCGTAMREKGNDYDYLVTFHDPDLPIHSVPPLLTHALSLTINQAPGVEELVGVDVEHVAVVTRFAGDTLLHYSQHEKLSALERLHVLAQVMEAVQLIHFNNYVHNNIRLSSVCLAPEGRCSATGMRIFRATLTDFTLCRQTRTPLLRDTGDNPGLYPWLCPEVVRGARCSEYSDVYSVGRLAAILEIRGYPYPNDLKTWVKDAMGNKSVVRQPLRRGLRYVQRLRKTLFKLYMRHPPHRPGEEESPGGASEG